MLTVYSNQCAMRKLKQKRLRCDIWIMTTSNTTATKPSSMPPRRRQNVRLLVFTAGDFRRLLMSDDI